LDDVALVSFFGIGGDHVVAQSSKKFEQRHLSAGWHRRRQRCHGCGIVKAAHGIGAALCDGILGTLPRRLPMLASCF
jgi:hypothetical protein